MSRLSTLGAAALVLAASSLEASAQIAEAPEPIEVDWQHEGLFGTFDRAAAQRGFQVYREVCSGCHGLTFVALQKSRGSRVQRGPGARRWRPSTR